MPSEQTKQVFRTVDTMRPDAFAGLFSENGTMVFGNAQPMIGRAAIAAGVQQFFSTIGSLRHEIVNDWQVGADTIAEAAVTYRRLDDRTVTVTAVSIWHTDADDLIDNYRVYVDLAPLYAP
jgi:hypothetical protein